MNILLIGSGGREHTLAWKLKQSKSCGTLFIAPGNAGTHSSCTNLDIAVNDFKKLAAACIKHNIEMIVVGPEEPLVKGIVDFFKARKTTSHIHIIGPAMEAAQLEGSKAYAKAFMKRHNIPTAAYQEFTAENYQEGVSYILKHALPIVLKADGLAAGKGVLICNSQMEALAEFELMIVRSKFGDAGKKVVIEEFLQGIEISVFALTDGKDYLLMPEAKDYKRIGEDDKGLNTGGMGAVSPVPFFTGALKEKIINSIVQPTIDGLHKENMDYKGFVFFGLMINKEEPFVIEYNCRLGDPETEVIIPRLENDLLELFLATAQNQLKSIVIGTDNRAAVAVVTVSGGYPGDYEKGKIIHGLEVELPGSFVFHAGTKMEADDVVTNGGRVLVITSFGKEISEAAVQSNHLVEQLYFEGINSRRDIGYEFI